MSLLGLCIYSFVFDAAAATNILLQEMQQQLHVFFGGRWAGYIL
jgi:hypothetical protein